jgi:hypothetical protein
LRVGAEFVQCHIISFFLHKDNEYVQLHLDKPFFHCIPLSVFLYGIFLFIYEFEFQSRRELEHNIEELNAGRPQCPVGLNTLVIPSKNTMTVSEKQPFVYLNCGHVHGQHDWGQDTESNERMCPMCRTVSASFCPNIQRKHCYSFPLDVAVILCYIDGHGGAVVECRPHDQEVVGSILGQVAT